MIVYVGGCGWCIKDMGSTNGTYIMVCKADECMDVNSQITPLALMNEMEIKSSEKSFKITFNY